MIRKHDLTQIRPFYESGLIKIIVRIRRRGKSVMMRQVISESENAGKKCLFLDAFFSDDGGNAAGRPAVRY